MKHSYLVEHEILDHRFQIGEELGRGGISVVYSARDLKIESDVALKLLVPPPATAELVYERTKREVAITRKLEHPNIVQVYDFGECQGRLYIVMRKVDGPTLKQAVDEKGTWSGRELFNLALQCTQALKYSHSKGILHRDIKPSNILLSHENKAFLADFGAAKLEGQQSITVAGSFVGTLNYLPPETFAGDLADARGDIYSLGLTLYYACVGRLPMIDANSKIVIPRKTGHCPTDAGVTLEPKLSKLIRKSTSENPRDRFQTANELLEYLQGDYSESKARKSEYIGLREKCLSCGKTSTLGELLCADCHFIAAENSNSQLILLEKAKSRRERYKLKVRLKNELCSEELYSTVKDEDIDSAVVGNRPLAEVALDVAPKVVSNLQEMGFQTKLVPASSTWSLIPVYFKILLLEIIAVGLINSFFLSLWHGIAGLGVAYALYCLVAKNIRRPLFDSALIDSPFSSKLSSNIQIQLSNLSSRNVRGILADLIETAKGILESDDRFLSEVSFLVEGALEACSELQKCDSLLIKTQERTSLAEENETLQQTRNLLVQRLLETLSTLAKISSGNAVTSARVLEEMNTELREEVQLRQKATQELELLILGN